MNIKVAAFAVSEKSSNTLQYYICVVRKKDRIGTQQKLMKQFIHKWVCCACISCILNKFRCPFEHYIYRQGGVSREIGYKVHFVLSEYSVPLKQIAVQFGPKGTISIFPCSLSLTDTNTHCSVSLQISRDRLFAK